MQKSVLLIAIILLTVGCKQRTTGNSDFIYKEVVTEYDSIHEEYCLYGIYKRVDIYNGRAYRDSFYYELYIDDHHFMGYYLNEFGDTITKEFVDTSNYPRREE